MQGSSTDFLLCAVASRRKVPILTTDDESRASLSTTNRASPAALTVGVSASVTDDRTRAPELNMSLADDYRRQFAMRSWSTVFSLLPEIDGQLVLDLGCGVGDQAIELTARGARVVGIDANHELLAVARARGIAGASFRMGDLKTPDVEALADGIGCSFAAAYVPDLTLALSHWKTLLKPGGWVAMVEVDDLFGHEPVRADTRELLAAYARDAFDKQRYDFHMGRKLRAHLEQAGYAVTNAQQVPDRELAFDGPADAEVVDAWKARLERMASLRNFCGSSFVSLRDDFIGTLSRADHRSVARVCCCIAAV